MRKHLLNKHQLIVLGLITSVLFSCKDNGAVIVPKPLPPAKAILLLPAQNEVCASGENQTATESTVRFDWSDAANADSYMLSLKNLITGKTAEYANIIQSETKIIIPRATAFSWTVSSKSAKSSTIATSDSWKFYNSGEGQISYTPFPATLTYPAMGQEINAAGNVTLTWSGSDADNDLASYDVYFGKSSPPALISTNKPDGQSFTVEVAAGTIYYWKIVTKDSKGNTSDSGVYQFKIN